MKRSEFMHQLRESCCEPAAADRVRQTWPAWMPRLAFGDAPRGDILVVVFLRGAADALNVTGNETPWQVSAPVKISSGKISPASVTLRAPSPHFVTT